jgi:Gas vesicle protein G
LTAVGLFTALATLPLAPVRGVAWVAQQVAEEAERQAEDAPRLRHELVQLELDHDTGLIEDDEYEERADALFEQLAQVHAAPGMAGGLRLYDDEARDG